MRANPIIALLIASTIVAPPLAVGQPPPFTITVSSQNAKVRVGDEVRVHVVLTNTTDRILALGMAWSGKEAEISYRVTVQDKSGKDATETDYGRAARKGQLPGSMFLMPLQPGQTMDEDLTLGAIYDITAPGEYTIQLYRPVTDNAKDGVIKSNKLVVEIVP